jgi:hypothetical protein
VGHEPPRPGPPPLAVMIAALSMRFACGACLYLLTVNGKTMLHKQDEIHGIHRECLHYVCGRYAGAYEQAGAFLAILRGNASVPSMLPYVHYVRRTYGTSMLNEWVMKQQQLSLHSTAADGTVMLKALLDHAVAAGWDLVTDWPTNADFPGTLLRCVLKSGNVEYMHVVLRRRLHATILKPTDVTQDAETNKWPVSDGKREVLAHYLA